MRTSADAAGALNPRQKRFVEEYLICGNAAEAAEAAGYSPANAAVRGERLLKDPAVQRYRRELEQALFESLGVSPAWIGRRLVEIVERCMQATPHYSRNPETRQREPDGCWEFDPTGAMRALHELDEHLRSLHREDETENELRSFEDWLSEQNNDSRL
ncbi:MAG: terminase small subunit [Oscillospiraceae bacterium]|nr:terminase small subunit [Oscillospiraceae bacterium]